MSAGEEAEPGKRGSALFLAPVSAACVPGPASCGSRFPGLLAPPAQDQSLHLTAAATVFYMCKWVKLAPCPEQ